jgi:hypothetical protein
MFEANAFIDAFRRRGLSREAFGTQDLRVWAGAIASPRAGVLESVAAIHAASFLPKDGDYSLNYDWQDRKAKGGKPNEEGPYRGGAGYLALSAVGAGKFLAAFDSGEIVPMSWVRTMKHEKYGFDGGYGSKAGRAVWKNGGCPGGSCKSWAIIFPGNVQAYLVTNSGYFVHDGTRDPKAGFNLGEVLVNAYNKAFQ